MSNLLLKKIQQIRKNHWNDKFEDQIDRIADAFTDCLRRLPDTMAEELFQHFSAGNDCGSRDSLYDSCAQRLADAADLFLGDYDTDNDPLLPDDWEFVRDIVSERATDLDMDLVSYLMKLVVDHGRI